ATLLLVELLGLRQRVQAEPPMKALVNARSHSRPDQALAVGPEARILGQGRKVPRSALDVVDVHNRPAHLGSQSSRVAGCGDERCRTNTNFANDTTAENEGRGRRRKCSEAVEGT